MIHDQDIERQVLGGMLKYPEEYHNVSHLLSDSDFYSEDSMLHLTLFRLIKKAYDCKESVDPVLLVSKLKDLNIVFTDNINVPEYILSLDLIRISPDIFIETTKQLKLISVRRGLYDTSKKIAQVVKKSGTMNYAELVAQVDQLFNGYMAKIESYGGQEIIDLFSEMESVLLDRAANQEKNLGLIGPYKKLESIYGSISRPGNIAIIVARSGVGKSTFSLDYSIKCAELNDVPVIHFDNGEMSGEETICRAAAALSGIPMWLIETGKYHNSSWNNFTAEEVREKVEDAIRRAKKIKFYYHNVAGMNIAEQVSMLKRIYFSKVGRNNQCLFCYDYIKLDFANLSVDSWVSVAKTVNDFKQAIHKQILNDKREPCIAMLSSVQANRSGITKNKTSDTVVDDESIVSLGDMITQFCSHLFLLRPKMLDELQYHGRNFGTHVLKCLKQRHLGKDVAGALNEVMMPDGAKLHNYINLKIENFSITECGDLRDVARYLSSSEELEDSSGNESLPHGL